MVASQDAWFLFSVVSDGGGNDNNGSAGGTSHGGHAMVPSGRKRKCPTIADGINYLPVHQDSLGNKNNLDAGLESDLRRIYAVRMSGKTGSLLRDLRVEVEELLEHAQETEFEFKEVTSAMKLAKKD